MESVCCRKKKLSYTEVMPSECWVILFYIYIFILIFLIKWCKKKNTLLYFQRIAFFCGFWKGVAVDTDIILKELSTQIACSMQVGSSITPTIKINADAVH